MSLPGWSGRAGGCRRAPPGDPDADWCQRRAPTST